MKEFVCAQAISHCGEPPGSRKFSRPGCVRSCVAQDSRKQTLCNDRLISVANRPPQYKSQPSAPSLLCSPHIYSLRLQYHFHSPCRPATRAYPSAAPVATTTHRKGTQARRSIHCTSRLAPPSRKRRCCGRRSCGTTPEGARAEAVATAATRAPEAGTMSRTTQ